MSDIDELDINPFFKQLQTSYADIYNRAQEKCYLLCIPQASSLHNYSISKTFVETHILRPSPYFKGQYWPLISTEKVVHLEENYFRTGEGFSSGCEAKIVSEELGYNKDYQPYRILVIEKPLDEDLQTLDNQSHNRTRSFGSQDGNQTFTYDWCKKTLLKEFGKVLKSLDESLEKFNSNYMILRDYLDDAKERLESISNEAVKKCLKCNDQKQQSRISREELDSLIECYVVGKVHQKLFTVICDKFAVEDENLCLKCKQLENVKAEKLGVSPHFCCPLPAAVVELANLNGHITPLEKLHCLKSTIDSITESIRSYIIDSHNSGLPAMTITDLPVLTSDDLIPILVTVIAQSKCSHLASNMFYMETFHWSTEINERDNLSYCLVTFKAALQYMANTDFDYLQTQSSKVKREISLDELMKSTRETTLRDEPEKIQSQKKQTPVSNRDKQLERISKLLENSPNDNDKSRKFQPKSVFGDNYNVRHTVPSPVPVKEEKKKQKLGAFLDSLDDDIFDQSFGKQS